MIFYMIWQILGQKTPIKLHMRNGISFRMRPYSDQANDFGVFYEIFEEQCYLLPHFINQQIVTVNNIIDIGSNCGATLLWWHKLYPSARIIGFEAHPANALAAKNNISLNGLESRISVIPAAVGPRDGTLRITDRGSGASAYYKNYDRYVDVPMIDLFAHVANQKFDLMKIDIEGAEFGIIADERFAQIAPPALTMEWHEVGMPGAHAFVHERLKGLGYHVHDLKVVPGQHGVLWAVRQA